VSETQRPMAESLGPLFDAAHDAAHNAAEAMRARDAAIQRVDEHADPAWRETALAAVSSLAAAGQPFTTDDVVRALPATVSTHEPRALGAVMQRLSREGAIVPVGLRDSSSTVCHGRTKRLWRGVHSSE